MPLCIARCTSATINHSKAYGSCSCATVRLQRADELGDPGSRAPSVRASCSHRNSLTSLLSCFALRAPPRRFALRPFTVWDVARARVVFSSAVRVLPGPLRLRSSSLKTSASPARISLPACTAGFDRDSTIYLSIGANTVTETRLRSLRVRQTRHKPDWMECKAPICHLPPSSAWPRSSR